MNLGGWNREILKLLTVFDASTGARGLDYFRRGRVTINFLDVDSETIRCETEVRGTQNYEVSVVLTNQGQGTEIESDCSCPVGRFCKHIYATLRSIHAEIGQRMDTDTMMANAQAGLEKKKRRDQLAQELYQVIESASGRKPIVKQRKKCDKIAQIFDELQTNPSRELMVSDMHGMGLRIHGYSWQEAAVWTKDLGVPRPDSIVDFWIMLVGFCRLTGERIDEDLNLPYDMSRADDFLEKLRTKFLEEAYRDFYHGLTYNIPSKNSLPVRTSLDFNLRLMKMKVDVQAIYASASGFKSLNVNELSYLWDLYSSNQLIMDEGAKMILECLDTQPHFDVVNLDFRDEGHLRILRSILQSPAARKKLVQRNGSPVVFETEKLEWCVEKSVQRSGGGGVDIEVCVVSLKFPSGRAVPEWNKFIHGNPVYYISNTLIAEGPMPIPGAFDINKPTVLPLEWVDRPKTRKAFRSLGIRMLDDSLKSETESRPEITIRPKIRFRAWIDEDSEDEVCEVAVSAINPDADEDLLIYGPTGWQWIVSRLKDGSDEKGEKVERYGVGDEGSEIIIDDSYIGIMPTAMAPLQADFDEVHNVFSLPLDRNFAEQFHTWLMSLPDHAVVELDEELAAFQTGSIKGKLGLRVESSDTDWFDVDIVLDTGDYELTPEEQAILIKAPGSWVRLKNGSWKKLEFEISEEDDLDLARLGLSPQDMNSGPRKAHALQLSNESARKWVDVDQYENIRRRAQNLRTEVTPEIPDGITATLRPYQRDGYHFLAYLSHNRFGGILADDMGLGKTLQTLTWLKFLHLDDSVKSGPVLVVCPKSVMENWSHEVEHFMPGVSVYVWDPSIVKQFAAAEDNFEVHVLNYAQMRNLQPKLNEFEWMAVVLDEAQNIKNPTSIAWKAASQLKSRFRLALTGTPIENRLMDLWSIMEFAMPGILGNRSNFQNVYNAKKDPLAKTRLSSRIRPFILRRTKDQVATDLPERVEEDILCTLTGEQDNMYKAELKRAQQIMLKVKTASEFNKVKFNVLTSLLRLRQICCHPKLYDKKSRGKSAKLEAMMEHVEAILDQGSKVLVFSQFVEMLDILAKEAKKKSWAHWLLTGQTENRGNLVKEFQSFDGPGVFFISLKAGGAGLNLTAAQYVVLFDPWWNPAVENQAIDRTHRIGQTNRVVAYRLLAKNTVEEKIRKLQVAKSELAAEVLDESKFSESLTMEDLEYIFRES